MKSKKEQLEPAFIMVHKPYLRIVWSDGTSTIVKCRKGDTWDTEKGIMACMAKRAFGPMRYNSAVQNVLAWRV